MSKNDQSCKKIYINVMTKHCNFLYLFQVYFVEVTITL